MSEHLSVCIKQDGRLRSYKCPHPLAHCFAVKSTTTAVANTEASKLRELHIDVEFEDVEHFFERLEFLDALQVNAEDDVRVTQLVA